MKKIIPFIFGLFFITMLLCGCDDGDREGLHGNDNDFIGTWKTGAGSFSMGDSIRFNPDYTCDFFWSHSSYTLFNGTWDRTFINNLGYCVVITMGEQDWTYIYDFFDGYKTLRLQPENSTEYIQYSKQ
jgi:hypothetical protein